MTIPFSDRVKQTTTSTGTGNITLDVSVPNGFKSFFSSFGAGVDIYYVIAAAGLTEWEVGIGHLTDSTTLVRTTVLDSSSGAGNKVSFSAGLKDVFSSVPAKFLNDTASLPEDIQKYGFLNQTETTLSWNGTDTFTIAPVSATWTYYRAGKRNTITGSKSITFTPVNGTLYFIFIDADDGTLSYSTSAWTLQDTKVPVAALYYDGTQTPSYFIGEERHSCLIDRRMHYYAHTTLGTKMKTVGALTGYTVNTDTDAAKTFAIAESVLVDEDIFETLPALADPNGTATDYLVTYRTAATTWKWTASAMPFPYNTGTNWAQYDNNGTLTDLTNGQFVNSYLCFTNDAGVGRHMIVPGRAVYTTLANAQAEDPSTFTFTGFPGIEFVVAYRLTWSAANGNTSKGKVRMAAEPKKIAVGAITTSATASSIDHSTLAGLQGGAVGDYYHLTSTQYSNLNAASMLTGNTLSSNVTASSLTSVGNLTSLTVTGNVSANYFTGNGSLLTGIASGGGGANVAVTNTWTARQAYTDGIDVVGTATLKSNKKLIRPTNPAVKTNGAMIAGSNWTGAYTGQQRGVVIHPNGRYVYATTNGSNALCQGSINQSTGVISNLSPSSVSTGSGPWGVCISPNGKWVYVANQSANTVSQYSVAMATGLLTSIGSAVACGTAPFGLVVHPNNKYLYVCNNTTGSISQYNINQSTGAISAMSPASVTAATPYFAAIDPTGRWLYATGGASNTILQFNIDQTTGALSAMSTPSIAAGTLPFNLCVDPTGRFVYAANQNSSNVSQYSIDQTTGQLTSIASNIAAGAAAWNPVCDPDGHILYVGNQNGNNIQSYYIDQTTGELTSTGYSKSTSNGPSGVAIDPSGRWLIVSCSPSMGVDTILLAQYFGALYGSQVYGTMQTAAQPNITSLGTLTGLSVDGTLAQLQGRRAVPGYSAPATGATVNLSLVSEYTAINPAGTLATLTVNLPAPTADGHVLNVGFTQEITALTITAAGGASLANGQPTTATAGQGFTWVYKTSTNTWYRFR